MVPAVNPALERFLGQINPEMVLAQVLICRREIGYELRHAADRAILSAELRLVALADLRSLAQFTAAGAFRPLKAAPNLPTGWRADAVTATDLESALNQLYPGALVDWFAAQTGPQSVTHYREFVGRQTGMYRVAAMLDDAQATRVITACCDNRFCLKCRYWTVAGLDPDAPAGKSLIPCLEPCAVLLEFARTASRIEQAAKVEISSEDVAVMQVALATALGQPGSKIREADFAAPSNPRRMQLLLEKLRTSPPLSARGG